MPFTPLALALLLHKCMNRNKGNVVVVVVVRSPAMRLLLKTYIVWQLKLSF